MYTNFLKNKYKWVPWITVIDSGNEWPNIAIMAVTHWNEIVWLSVFDNLVNKLDLWNKLLKWKIYLIAVNILAYNNFNDQSDSNKYRFVDDNMNRIHWKEYKWSSYEFKRKKELEPIFDELDVILDLHSVAKWEDIICISDERNKELSSKIFNAESILLDDISKSWALIWYITAKGKVWFGLECGNHTSLFWFKNWIENSLNLLYYYGIIDKKYLIKHKKYKQTFYKFITEIFPKSILFKYKKDFSNFTEISQNEVFWIDGDYKYKNIHNKIVYIWFIKKNIILNDWCGFLFERVE